MKKTFPWRSNPGTFLLTGLFSIGLFLISGPSTAVAKYIQLDGAANVKTRFSRGCASIGDIAEMAKRLRIDVVLFGDMARDSLEYGIFPFERIIKKTEERPSILTNGAGAYLGEIKDVDREFQDILLIPGVEAAPFYYWSGNVFKNNLVAHNWNKRLWLTGLPLPEMYEQIPLLNSNFSRTYVSHFQNTTIGFGLLFLVCAGLVYKKMYRKITVPLTVVFLLLTLNNHPFRSSPFDQYHGDQGVAPYQELIRFANQKGAQVFWSHMEPDQMNQKAGSVKINTPPHSEDLVLTKQYTGFQAVSTNPVEQIHLEQEWDRVLKEYVQGKRMQPVWAYGASNYYCEDKGVPFGDIRTIFLVKEKSPDEALEALKEGRTYSVRQSGEDRLSLDQFIVYDRKTRREATLGEELPVTDIPEVRLNLRSIQGLEKTATVSLIRNGEIVKENTVSLPYQMKWRDWKIDKSGKAYYRVKAAVSSVDYLVSNPIFVRFPGMPAETAALPEEAPGMREPEKPVHPRKESPDVPKPSRTPDAPASPAAPELPKPDEKTTAPKTAAVKPSSGPSPGAASDGRYVEVLIDGVSIRKGPGTKFPQLGRANKGDRLLFVRRTSVVFNDKVWLQVEMDDQKGFVWEGLVKMK